MGNLDWNTTIAQLEDKLNKAIDLDFQRREMVEQLQARIGELESGIREPVMKLEAERLWGGAGEYVVSFVKAGWLDECRRTGGEFLLYTAPPAPVAALWEIRIPDEPQNPESPAEYFYAQNADNRDLLLMREGATVVAEYACLEATAALNGDRK